jgi:hypothetical protein
MTTMDSEDYKGLVSMFMDHFDTPRDPEHWLKLVEEEAEEFLEAYVHLLKEAADLVYVAAGLAIVGQEAGTYPSLENSKRLWAVGEVCGMIPETFSPEVIEEAFYRVHESNMSKLDDAGNPIKREDGKVLKSLNYVPPDLRDLITP